MEFWLTLLGVLLIVEGIPWFLSPPRMKTLLRQIQETGDPALRFIGLTCMLAGLVLVYLASR